MMSIWVEKYPIKSNIDGYTHIMVELKYSQSERSYIVTVSPVKYDEHSSSYAYPSLRTIIGFDEGYKVVKRVGRRSARADSDAGVLATTYAPKMVQAALKYYNLELEKGE